MISLRSSFRWTLHFFVLFFFDFIYRFLFILYQVSIRHFSVLADTFFADNNGSDCIVCLDLWMSYSTLNLQVVPSDYVI